MSQTNTNREKKIRSILERSSNIDVQTLQKYVDKKLTKEELHEIEKQLLNSDFAAEAAEGFANADFKVNIAASTNQLNKEIKKYNKERGFYKTDYRLFYAAASVALIFVVLFGLTRGFVGLERDESVRQDAFDISEAQPTTADVKENENIENSLALNEESREEEEKDNTTTEIRSNRSSNQDTKTQNNLALNKDETRAETDFSTSDIWIKKKEKVEDENSEVMSSNNSVASSPVRANTQVYSDSISINTEQLADDDYNFLDEKTKTDRNKKSSKETFFDAMQSYENRRYAEAILLFDSYLITHPNDAQALYFGGLSHYQNQEYRKTIPLLEKFLNQKSSIIYQKNNQDAEWSLANAYLKTNQTSKAKTLLQKIVDSKNKYSGQAKLLLSK